MPTYQINLPELRDSAGNLYEPTGEFRLPKAGEWFLFQGQKPVSAGQADFDFEEESYIILRPVWQWPQWLGGWGFAANERGDVCWFELLATCNPSCDHFWHTPGRIVAASVLAKVYLGFTPPTITDWTKPVLNPNWNKDASATDAKR